MTDRANERALRIVVLDGRGDEHANEVTAAIAHALESEQQADPATDGRGTDAAATPQALLHAADAAVALDSGSLARAREAGALLCVAVLPGFDGGWAGDFADADRVFVAHDSLVASVVRRGAHRDAVSVVGPIAPVGYTPVADKNALRAELGIDVESPLVLVPADVLEDEGADAVMIQLSLVSRDVAYLFYVDGDAETAEELRRLAPAHGLTGWMFADERGAERYWQIADVVVGRARGYEVTRALAVGAPVVLLPPGRSDAGTVKAIEDAGVGRDADVLATLAVTLEASLETAALRDAREAIAALEMDQSAERLAAAVRDAWSRRSQAGAAREPRGLPHGLERLPRERSKPRHSSVPPASDDIEARIDRELAELKKRI